MTFQPTRAFALFAIGAALLIAMCYEAALQHYGLEASRGHYRAFDYVLAATIAVWIEVDRRHRAVSLPFEFAAFVFFLWPILAPWYLFRTRRWVGLGYALVFIAAFTFLPGYGAYALALLFAP